jgi:hypothetical protein
MKAKSIKGNSPEKIKTALQQSMADGFKPTLAVVFMSTQMDVPGVIAALEETGMAIFGESTAGEFTDAGIDKGSAAILLLDISPEYFSIVFKDIEDQRGREVAKQIGVEGKKVIQHPAAILGASHIETTREAIIEGFIDALGAEATIIGGIAGDDLRMEGGFVFTNHQFSHRGIVALFLDQDKIEVQGLAISGWKAVGTPKTITKSKGNQVYTIDDQPALDMLIRFTGLKINTDNATDLIQQIGLAFPLQITKGKGSPTMLPALMYNPVTKAILCGGNIPQGSTMRFSLPPDFDVIDTVIDSARQMKTSTLPDIDAMIIFSCIGRLTELGPLVEEEINGLKEVWKVPLAGYFSYGEFGRTEGGNLDFHGSTCSWVALKEK